MHNLKRRLGVEYSKSMLEPVRPGAVSPDTALYLPTFSHFVIVNKTSLSLSLSLSIRGAHSPPPLILSQGEGGRGVCASSMSNTLRPTPPPPPSLLPNTFFRPFSPAALPSPSLSQSSKISTRPRPPSPLQTPESVIGLALFEAMSLASASASARIVSHDEGA
jgi:hypothetical protein